MVTSNLNDVATPSGVLTDEQFYGIQNAGGLAAVPVEDRGFFGAHLNQFMAFRESAPNEAWKQYKASEDAKRAEGMARLGALSMDFDKATAGVDLPSLKLAPDPATKQAGKEALLADTFIQHRTGQGFTGATRERMRDAVATEFFGEGVGVGSDAEFAKAANAWAVKNRDFQKLVAGDGQDDSMSLQRWAAKTALVGVPSADAFAEWQKAVKDSPEYAAAKGKDLLGMWNDVYGKTSALVGDNAPRLRAAFEKMQASMGSKPGAAAGGDGTDVFDVSAALEGMSLEDFRTVGVPAIRAMAEFASKGDKGVMAQMLESFTRPVGNNASAFGDVGIAVGETVMNAFGSLLRQAPVPTDEDGRAMRSTLRQLMDNTVDPISNLAKSGVGMNLENMLYDTAGSLGMMSQLAVPYVGAALQMAGYQDATVGRLLMEHPTMKPEDARLIGAIEAPFEYLGDKLEFAALKGRLPGASKLLSAMAGPGGSVGKFLGYVGLNAGIEYAAEKYQDAVPIVTQNIIAALKEDVPAGSWDDFKMLDLRTFLAVLPLSLIGAGAHTVVERGAVRELVQDKDLLRVVGFSDDQISQITTGDDVGKRVEMVQALWSERGPVVTVARNESEAAADAVLQDPTAEVSQKVAAADYKATLGAVDTLGNAQADWKAAQAAMDDAGLSMQVERGADGKPMWTVRDRETGNETEHPNFNSAWAHVHGKMGEMDVEDALHMATVAEFFIKQKSGMGESVEFTGQVKSALDALAGENATAEAMAERIRIEEQRQGLQPGELVAPLVLGSNRVAFAEMVGDATKRVVAASMSKINAGGNVLTVIEEVIEGREKAVVDRDMKIRWVRMAEQATGEQFLQRGAADAEVSARDLTEAISHIVQAEVLNRRKNGGKFARAGGAVSAGLAKVGGDAVASGQFKTFLRAMKALLGAIFRTAAKLSKAQREGKLGEDYHAFVDQLLGLDEQARHNAAAAAEVGPVGGETFSLGGATPAMDAEYLKAVEDGDVAKQQAMVDAAAKAAGYVHQGLKHGSSVRFDKFMAEFRGSAAGGVSANEAFFLTDSERTARGYAVHAAEDGPVKRIMRDADLAEKRGDWDEQERLIAQAEDMVYGEEGAAASAERRKNAVVYSLFARGKFLEVDAKGKSAEEFGSLTATIQKARRQKLDGAIFRNLDDAPNLNDPATHFAVFSSNNIKSADPVTRDASGNVIPLSQRFNPESDSISYSLASGDYLESIAQRLDRAKADPVEKLAAFTRAAEKLSKAQREGKLGEDYHAFVDQLLGLDEQARHNAAAENIVTSESESFSLAAMNPDMEYPKAERDAASPKNQKAKVEELFPASMPQGVRSIIRQWEVVSKSPWSDSFYDITNKSFGPDPLGHLRVADHWNWEIDGVLHGATDIEVPKASWVLAQKTRSGYEVLKIWPKNEAAAELKDVIWTLTKTLTSHPNATQRKLLAGIKTKGVVSSSKALTEGLFNSHLRVLVKRGFDSKRPRESNYVELSEIGQRLVQDDGALVGVAAELSQREEELKKALAEDISPSWERKAPATSEANDGGGIKAKPSELSNEGRFPAPIENKSTAGGNGQETFSLASGDYLESIAQRLDRAKADPVEKLAAFTRAAEKLAGMARAVRFNDANAIKRLSTTGIERERARRQAEMLDEAYREIDQRYPNIGELVWNSSIANNPLMDFLTTVDSKTGKVKSRMMSKAAALRRGLKAGGEYDGGLGLPGFMFGGNEDPDSLAKDAYLERLIPEEDVNIFWEEINKALAQSAKDQGRLEKYQLARREARDDVRREAAKWAKDQMAKQNGIDWEKRELGRAMAALDAMLVTFPPEVRQMVGGFTKLADLKGNKARLAFFAERVLMLEKAMDRHLEREYTKEMKALIERSRPKGDKGEKIKGKIGVQAHEWFAQIEPMLKMSSDAVAERLAGIEMALADVEDSVKQTELTTEWSLLQTYGAWGDKSALEMASAFGDALTIFDTGRAGWVAVMAARRAEREGLRGMATNEAGGRATRAAEDAGNQRRRGFKGATVTNVKGWVRNLFSFRQVLASVFGHGSGVENRFDMRTRQATRLERAARIRREVEFAKALGDIYGAGKRIDRQRLLWDLVQPVKKTGVYFRETSKKEQAIPLDVAERILSGEVSAKESGLKAYEITELRWLMQEHLEKVAKGAAGARAENLYLPKLTRGKEHEKELSRAQAMHLWMTYQMEEYRPALARDGVDEQTMKEIEGFLKTPDLELINWLGDQYEAGYDHLNAPFQRLYGVALPKVKHYAPGTFQTNGNQAVALPGDSATGTGAMQSGFLRKRKNHTSKIDLSNEGGALAHYWRHVTETEHWVAWAETVDEMKSVFFDKEVNGAVKAGSGISAADTLRTWVDTLENDGVKSGWVNLEMRKWLAAMMTGRAKVGLAWKVSVWLKQSTAALGSMLDLPAKDFARSAARVLAGKGAMAYGDAKNLPVMQQRLAMGGSPEMRLAMQGATTYLKPGAVTEFMDTGMDAINTIDARFTMFSAAVAFDAHYNSALKAGLSEEAARVAAAELTDRTLARTAQPVETMDKSLHELSLPTIAKPLFMFISEVRQKAALEIAAVAGAFKGEVSWFEAGKIVAWNHLVLGSMTWALGAMWRDLMNDDDDSGDDPAWEVSDWLLAIITGPLAGVPVLGDVITATTSWATGAKAFPGESNLLAGNVADLAKGAHSVFSGDPPEGEELEFILKKVGMSAKALGQLVGGEFAAVGVGANIFEQMFNLGDDLIETDAEATGKERKKLRKLDKEAREAAEEARRESMTPEQRQAEDDAKAAKKQAEADAELAKLRAKRG